MFCNSKYCSTFAMSNGTNNVLSDKKRPLKTPLQHLFRHYFYSVAKCIFLRMFCTKKALFWSVPYNRYARMTMGVLCSNARVGVTGAVQYTHIAKQLHRDRQLQKISKACYRPNYIVLKVYNIERERKDSRLGRAKNGLSVGFYLWVRCPLAY